MFENLFQSPDRPFRATPDPKFYYAHESVETARQTVVRAVVRAEGPVMVLGGAGLGKSMLSLLLTGDLSARFDAVKLHAARLCSRRALLQNILFELQLPYRDLSEGELRLSILDRLEPSPQHAPDGVLLIVDEAHTLPAKLLDELRLITNFTRNNQPRARLVLIGSLRLEDTFAEPQMESFNQRLAARCYLTPMNRQQTRDFVRHQLTAAGVVPHEFITDSALDTVYAASEGVPRLANQIMDHTMVLSITRNQCPISSALIEEAWADLQQLPAPWHSGAEAPETTAAPAAIEFGTLEDEDVLTTTTSSDEISVFESESSNDATEDESGPTVHVEAIDERWIEHTPEVQPTEEASKEALDDACAETDHPSPAVSRELPPLRAQFDGDEQVDGQVEDRSEANGSQPQFDAVAEAQEHEETFDSNFFAAFAPPEEELPAERASDGDPEPANEELLRPVVDFDANHEAFSDKSGAVAKDGSELPTDSFFSNRPTDEKLLALEDEQTQYDSMGVWENDPPLDACEQADAAPEIVAASQQVAAESVSIETRDSEIRVSSVAVDAVEGGNEVAKTRHQLFGDDFEDEVLIANEGNSRYSPLETSSDMDESTYAAPSAAGTNLDQSSPNGPTVEPTEIIGRVEDDVPALGILRATTFQEPRVLDDIVHGLLSTDVVVVENENSGTEAEDKDQAWSVDISSVDAESEMAVHSEIEDLVSQLNFSAFSVEPYSVEQISIEPGDNRLHPLEGSVRIGDNDEVYALHRKQDLQEERFFSDVTAAYDDDRSMLIIEEDLQPQQTENDNVSSVNPPLKIAPYSQLFAKLRK